MLLQIHSEDPEPRKIQQVTNILEKGGVIIYPTDTVYGLGCDIFNKRAVEKICKIRKIDPKKAMLTFICKDIGQIAEYSYQLDNQLFKLLKRNLPGPFTFILKSSNAVPKILKNNKRTIGVRIPDNKIVNKILASLGRPMLSISLKDTEDQDEEHSYFTEAWEIEEKYGKIVDLIIGNNTGGNTPSTLIDCSNEPHTIIRQGAGEVNW